RDDIFPYYPELNFSDMFFGFRLENADGSYRPIDSSMLNITITYEAYIQTNKSYSSFKVVSKEQGIRDCVEASKGLEHAFENLDPKALICPESYNYTLYGDWTQTSLSFVNIAIKKCKN